MQILVTGGTGYIGSHTIVELINHGYDVVSVPYKIAPRRNGDVPMYFADPKKAKEILHWETSHDLEEMVESAYNFAKRKCDHEK